MRVIFVHPAIRTYREPLFRLLGDAGVDFLFTSINDPKAPAGVETLRILKSFNYPYKQAREISFFGRKNFSFDLLVLFHYDVVVFSCATSIPFLFMTVPLRLLGKRVLLFDELWRYPSGLFSYRLIRPFVRLLCRRFVNHFIFAGTRAKQFFTEEMGIKSETSSIAYNTTVPTSPCPAQFNHLEKLNDMFGDKNIRPPVILYLGRLVRYKGLDVLLHAVSKLRTKPIVLVVGDGPFQSYCKDLAHDLGISRQVHFWGACNVEEAACFYRLSDIFVLPARFVPDEAVGYESWGFTINEAMSTGVPVITSTAVGAAYDLIKHGETGFIFEADDVDHLCDQLDLLLSDRSLARKVGEAGRQWVAERCSYEQNYHSFAVAIGLLA